MHVETDHATSVLTLVSCLVVVAGFVRDAMVVSILPYPFVVPSLTGARLSTRDYVLDRQISRWPCAFPLDVDTIYKAKKC